MKSLFQKKIKCFHCLGSMKQKIERGKIKYVCSKYSNDSTSCTRKALIEESTLSCLIYKRYGELSNDEVREILDEIIVESNLLFEIKFVNGDESILFSRNHIRY